MINLLTSLQNFKNYIDKDNTDDDNVLEDWIVSASGDIEEYTQRLLRGRTYGANGLPAEFHNGNGEDKIVMDQYPIISVTELYDDLARDFDSTTLKSGTNDYIIWKDQGMIQLLRDAPLGSSFSIGTANIKAIYTAGYDTFEIITGRNDELDFEETGAAELTATIASGVYTAAGLATAIKTALEVAGASVYTISYDYFTSIFTLASDRAGAGGTFKLLWNGGTNKSISIGRTIGFDVSADDADAASHAADYSRLGIPRDLEQACIELVVRTYKESHLGSSRFDLKKKMVTGERAGTTEYVGGLLPPGVQKLLQPYRSYKQL